MSIPLPNAHCVETVLLKALRNVMTETYLMETDAMDYVKLKMGLSVKRSNPCPLVHQFVEMESI